MRVSSPVLHVRRGLENQHRRVFREVDAASLAFTALFLNMPAGGTSETERCVTAGAELYALPILVLALGALHRKRWWTRRDSNPRPQRCERRALPTELRALGSQYRMPIYHECGAGVPPAVAAASRSRAGAGRACPEGSEGMPARQRAGRPHHTLRRVAGPHATVSLTLGARRSPAPLRKPGLPPSGFLPVPRPGQNHGRRLLCRQTSRPFV